MRGKRRKIRRCQCDINRISWRVSFCSKDSSFIRDRSRRFHAKVNFRSWTQARRRRQVEWEKEARNIVTGNWNILIFVGRLESAAHLRTHHWDLLRGWDRFQVAFTHARRRVLLHINVCVWGTSLFQSIWMKERDEACRCVKLFLFRIGNHPTSRRTRATRVICKNG